MTVYDGAVEVDEDYYEDDDEHNDYVALQKTAITKPPPKPYSKPACGDLHPSVGVQIGNKNLLQKKNKPEVIDALLFLSFVLPISPYFSTTVFAGLTACYIEHDTITSA